MDLTGATIRRLIRRASHHTLFGACRDNSEIAPAVTSAPRTLTRKTGRPPMSQAVAGTHGAFRPPPTGRRPACRPLFQGELHPRRSALDHPDFHFRLDVGVQLDRDLVDAEGLDRLVQVDLALLDVQTLRLQLLGNVAGGHRAEELALFADASGERDREIGKLLDRKSVV